jgi:integrase
MNDENMTSWNDTEQECTKFNKDNIEKDNLIPLPLNNCFFTDHFDSPNSNIYVAPIPGSPGMPQVSSSSPSIMLSELMSIHLKWVRENRAAETLRGYQVYEKHFLNFAGDRPVSTITRLMLENFFAWGKSRGTNPNSGIVFARHIKGMLLWAQEMDICPCPVRKFPSTPETPPPTKRFSDEELQKLLNYVWPGSEEFRSMIIFGLHTGLRPIEIRELKRSQVHNDTEGNYTVFIQNHKTAKTAHEPKPRSVPLTPTAKNIVLKQLVAHPKSEYIFLNAKGKPYTRGVFRQRLIRWCKRAGIKPHPPYAMRHYAELRIMPSRLPMAAQFAILLSSSLLITSVFRSCYSA